MFLAPSAGSNGHEFMFLLKGHEDLRQDERVMQLFGLVNTLLANDPASLRKNLRYKHKLAADHGRKIQNLFVLPFPASSATQSFLCPPTRA